MNDFTIGNEFYINKDFLNAKVSYLKYLEEHPEDYIASHNLGITNIQLGLDEEALKCLELPCSVKYDESFISKGVALRNLGRYHEALESFAMAFTINPNHATAYSNYGNTLREFGIPDRAIDFLRIANKIHPGNPNYQMNECVSHLLKGDLLEGWKLYEARWFYQSEISFKPELPGIEFNGSQDISGLKIVVYYEQGFGDCIQFARYIPLLKQLNPSEIIVVMRKQLMELYKHNFPYVTLVEASENIPPYHYHVALLALPGCFKTTLETIPSPGPYLTVGEDIITEWSKRLGPKTKPRIGLLWSPNKEAYITRFRQIDLELLLSITSDKYEFISLSYEMDEHTDALLKKHNVKEYHQHLNGFYNTGGLIKNLDLVISIDTVIPHLSGAMGIPTWILLSDYASDWRWFMNRNDSPFYSCVSLVRQQNHSWDNVLNLIRERLG